MVTFNFTYDPGVTVQQALGFEMAGRIWSHFLSDPVTLNLHVGMSNTLPANVIGGALPGILPNTSYATFRNRLQLDATSNRDQASGLAASIQGQFVLREASGNTGNIVNTNIYSLPINTLNVTRAGAKAVGIAAGNDTALDGTIVMGSLVNSQFRWNYDFTRSSVAPSGSLDFLSVALHEIGHILGFVSGVDKPGMMNATVLGNQTERRLYKQQYEQHLPGRVPYATPLDLFRLMGTSTMNMNYGGGGWFRNGQVGASDTAIQADRAFQLAEFAYGRNQTAGGDGYQGSHWKENGTGNAVGIMDPAVAPQEQVSITNLDLAAFDAIGWDLRNGLNTTTFTTAFLNNFQTQAVASLATQLGQTTTWINSNLTAAPTNLGRDRTTDVETMIRNSLIYEWGTTGSGTTSTSGRRWMEIFNQMASAQEVYVNFSTVYKGNLPSETVNGDGQRVERRQGDRQNPKKNDTEYQAEAIRDNPGSEQTNHDLKDPLSGIDSGLQLIGLDLDSFPNPGQPSPTMTPDFLSTSTVAAVKWSPVATRMSETAVASDTSSGVGIGSHQQASSLFATGLDTLLGTENNPLAQGGLSMGVMGATLAVTAKPHA